MRTFAKSVKPGDVYGDLEVLERIGSSARGAAIFRCRCRLCGADANIEGQRLKGKRSPRKNCGCVDAYKKRDISGETHGSIIVLERMQRNAESGEQMYLVTCLRCKQKRVMPKSQILTNPASCGCKHYDTDRMTNISKLGIASSIVDGVNINSVYKQDASCNSKTGVRGVFPERRHGILTGTYRAAVMVHGERRVRTGFVSINAAKQWRDESQQELIEKYNVKPNTED